MAERRLRIAFFGTPEFALPALERLRAGPHELCVVVSQPDRPRGRGRHPTPSPVSRAAEHAGIPLVRPERVGDPAAVDRIARSAPDLGVVVAFGQFLPRRVRELPSLGYLINGHASLLPRHRGAAPIQHAILAGDRVTGVSVMRIEREMDAGPVALALATPIGPEENAGELAARLAALAADALAEAVAAIARGEVRWTPQDPAAVTFAPKIRRADGELDWSQPAEQLARCVRAFAPSPGAFTHLAGEPLRVLAARTLGGPVDRSPGTTRVGSDGAVQVATGDGWLVPTRVQRAGGRALEMEAFLRGRPVPDGTALGQRLSSAP